MNPITMRNFSVAMCLIAGLVAAPSTSASDVTVAGLFPGKALVQVDGSALRTVAVGDTAAEGVTLLSVTSDTATFDVRGKRVTRNIEMGRIASRVSTAVARLLPDGRGHFRTTGEVNGLPIRFMVDTGATLVVLPASDAQRLGIDYRQGIKGTSNTAAGKVAFYGIKLESVRVGNVTLRQVDGAVMEGDGPSEALLGMSFLGQTNVTLDNDAMTLTKR